MSVSVAIIVAMESERVHLDTLMPAWEPVEDAAWPTLQNGDVVCITSGIGMVFAAAATEHAIRTYHPTIVMNFGCAGAHHRELFPGDVVIGDQVIHQGRMRIAPNGELIPFDIGFQVPGERDLRLKLSTDPVLRQLAQEVADTTPLSEWPEGLRSQNHPHRAPEVRTGTVSSGDIWLQSADHLDAAHTRTGSLCEDMEAASIAQICALHETPFLTVKDISNNEFHEKTVFEGTSSALHSDELGMRAATTIVGVINKLNQIGGLRRMHYS